MYSDSDDEGGNPGAAIGDDGDSDEELRQTIRRKKKDFQTTERSILQRLQAEEEAERRGGEVSDGGDAVGNGGEVGELSSKTRKSGPKKDQMRERTLNGNNKKVISNQSGKSENEHGKCLI